MNDELHKCPECGAEVRDHQSYNKLIIAELDKELKVKREDTERLTFLFSGIMSDSNAVTELEKRLLAGETLTLREIRDGIDAARASVPRDGWSIPREKAQGTGCYQCKSLFPGFGHDYYKCEVRGHCPALADTAEEAIAMLEAEGRKRL